MKEVNINPLDDLFPVIVQAVNEWNKDNPPDVIAEKVKRRLDASSQEITLKLLGFTSRYSDTWELDHCNGRAGNSAAGDYLRNTQQDVIQDWFATNLMPVLSPKIKASLQREMNSEYVDHVRTQLRKMTKEKAEKDAEAIFTALSADNQSQKYKALLALLNPEK